MQALQQFRRPTHPYDLAENMTAAAAQGDDLSDAQRQMIGAATAVFEELLAGTKGAALLQPDGAREGPTPDNPRHDGVRFAQMRAVIARTFDVYSTLFLQSVDLLEDLLQEGLSTALPEASSVAASSLVLAGSRGDRPAARLWICNSTNLPATNVVVWMTDLTAHHGAIIRARNGAVAPDALTVPAGGIEPAGLTVAIPDDAAAGVYHGHVLAVGLPDASLPLRLVVT
ncbi:hypothetical protein [Kribbella sp. NBC_00359]|uniref:hypothetical protein n=1 Tax=Kribbella sp. NBC_00359 TaxID=2975966 RepID=UPI002E206EBE